MFTLFSLLLWRIKKELALSKGLNQSSNLHSKISKLSLVELFHEEQIAWTTRSGWVVVAPKDRFSPRSDLFLEVWIVNWIQSYNWIQKCEKVHRQGWFSFASQEGLSLHRAAFVDGAAAASPPDIRPLMICPADVPRPLHDESTGMAEALSFLCVDCSQ